MAIVRWNDNFYADIFQLAFTGLKDKDIAEILGISKQGLARWKKINPSLKYTLEKARDKTGKEHVKTFKSYVYNQLPKKLRKLWDEIDGIDNEEDISFERVEKILKGQGKRTRQHLFMHAIVNSNFNTSEACRKIGITRTQLEAWSYETEFAELLLQIHKYKGDYFEGNLFKIVERGSESATIFANRTFNKDRGYGDKMTLEHTGTVNHEHVHVHYPIQDLDLPLETLKEIRKAIRVVKQQKAIEAETVDAN